MSFEICQTIGEYEFIDIVSSSSSSVAYRVRNKLAQRFELLCVLRQIQEDPQKRDRFMREIRALARIQHPNIVSFFHATQLSGQLVLTTELAEGATLAQRLKLGRTSISQSLEYIDQVLSALEYAHAHGVIHRDVTPGNIIITREGRVKLTGFGLAKTMSDPELTQPGTVLGSLNYMSPEQVNGLPTLDARTDIYAVGAVLYELVTGRPPFQGRTQFDVMFAHVNSKPTPPKQLNPEIPAELNELILCALAKEPTKRPQTALELREKINGTRQPQRPSRKDEGVPKPPAHNVPVGFTSTQASHIPSDRGPAAATFLAGMFMLAFAVLAFLAIVRMR